MRDPRYKQEYLDRVWIWITVTEGNGDESDKHVEARDHRYSCLKKCRMSSHTINIGQFLKKDFKRSVPLSK